MGITSFADGVLRCGRRCCGGSKGREGDKIRILRPWSNQDWPAGHPGRTDQTSLQAEGQSGGQCSARRGGKQEKEEMLVHLSLCLPSSELLVFRKFPEIRKFFEKKGGISGNKINAQYALRRRQQGFWLS